jgi:hypothetical protein
MSQSEVRMAQRTATPFALGRRGQSTVERREREASLKGNEEIACIVGGQSMRVGERNQTVDDVPCAQGNAGDGEPERAGETRVAARSREPVAAHGIRQCVGDFRLPQRRSQSTLEADCLEERHGMVGRFIRQKRTADDGCIHLRRGRSLNGRPSSRQALISSKVALAPEAFASASICSISARAFGTIEALDRNELGHGSTMPRDRHLLATLDTVEQGGQVSLGLERSDAVHRTKLNQKANQFKPVRRRTRARRSCRRA